jgi:hypothetical protein
LASQSKLKEKNWTTAVEKRRSKSNDPTVGAMKGERDIRMERGIL